MPSRRAYYGIAVYGQDYYSPRDIIPKPIVEDVSYVYNKPNMKDSVGALKTPKTKLDDASLKKPKMR